MQFFLKNCYLFIILLFISCMSGNGLRIVQNAQLNNPGESQSSFFEKTKVVFKKIFDFISELEFGYFNIKVVFFIAGASALSLVAWKVYRNKFSSNSINLVSPNSRLDHSDNQPLVNSNLNKGEVDI